MDGQSQRDGGKDCEDKSEQLFHGVWDYLIQQTIIHRFCVVQSIFLTTIFDSCNLRHGALFYINENTILCNNL